MFTKISINNYLSCIHSEFSLNAHNTFVGRNGAGKSNILKAITEVCKYASNISSSSVKYLTSESRLEFAFSLKEKEFIYSIYMSQLETKNSEHAISEKLQAKLGRKYITVAAKKLDVISVSEGDIHIKTRMNAPMLPTMQSVLPSESLSEEVALIIKYFSGVGYYPLNNEYNASNDSIIDSELLSAWRKKKTNSSTSSSMIDPPYYLIDLYQHNKETFDEIVALVGPNGFGLIDLIDVSEISLPSKTEDEGPQVYYFLRFAIGASRVSFSSLSFGTKRIVSILLAIICENNSLVLFEQPEDGIHTGLLRKLVPHLFTYAEQLNKQLIITTHSADIINLVDANALRIISKSSAGTKISQIEEEQLEYLKDFIEDEGTLSEFLEVIEDC